MVKKNMKCEDRIAALEARVAQLEKLREPKPSDSDMTVLRVILPCIKGAHGSTPWRVSELFSSIRVMKKLTTLTPQRLGLLFARCQNFESEGLVIKRVATESGILLWQIVECVDSTPRKPVSREQSPARPLMRRLK